MKRRLIGLVAALCITGSLVAQTTRDAPGSYMGREIAQTMHYTGAEWLTRESRQREEDCKTLLKELDVKKGQTICDLGCGNGFYTLKLAQMVGPEGKVIGVDIQQEMLDMLRKRAEAEKVSNVDPVLGGEDDPKLVENSIDLVLMVDVYHELSKPAEVLAHVRHSLKKGGRVALVEFRGEDPNVPIKPLHKMTRQQIVKEWTANGFKIAREFEGLPWQHLIFLEVDEAGGATTRSAP
ncbi:MAG TPA: class I SAM-dependent methyltransferase [Tepidisphaeraceae bacterium]|jgi:ubiquinone/menaquinone biosynthesis C-methylase UbiE